MSSKLLLEPAEVLGDHVAKQLGDRLYEKRKQAATLIEELVRRETGQAPAAIQALPAGERPPPLRVQQILECLRKDYVKSETLPNHRKGGLYGLASVAIGLDKDAALVLEQLVQPVLDSFRDEDPRVRYYACEALYNIAKVADDAVLTHLNEIFEAVCQLHADVDVEVKNGVAILDRLMKDLVAHHTKDFRAAEFIPLLAKTMRHRNPNIGKLTLHWIIHLLTLEVDMAQYLPLYLEGLFNMLSDVDRENQHDANSCLKDLQNLVTSSPHERALQIITDTTGTIIQCCRAHNNNNTRLTALLWLAEYCTLQIEVMGGDGQQPASKWIQELPNLLQGTFQCIDDPEEDFARQSVDLNKKLLYMVENAKGDITADRLVKKLLHFMKADASREVRTACLQWLCMLLQRCPEEMLQKGTLDGILDPIFETLRNPEDDVVKHALTVLAKIMVQGKHVTSKEGIASEDSPQDLFMAVTRRLLGLFDADQGMSERRRRDTIRQLCGQLDPRRFYVTVAQLIQDYPAAFAQLVVQTFSWILLTAQETKVLREELLRPAPGPRLFSELLEPWFRDPVSALALCLWAQEYALATELTLRFASFEPTLDMLRQLDQLVHLLESPVFSRLRLQLLEPRKHPALLKCILGLAMLLPQAGAFSILRERVRVLQGGLLLEATAVTGPPTMRIARPNEELEASRRVDTSELFDRFDAMLGILQ